MAFFEFPHTRTYDSDLGWLIKSFNEISEKLDTYLENAVIKFADPITWDITEQYTALTMVIDSDGTAYISKQPVPAGIDISNTDYWLPVFNYDDNINQLRGQIAYNAGHESTASVALPENSLLFWNGIIYRTMTDIPQGTAYIIGTNIEQYTVQRYIDDLRTYTENADTSLSGRIDDAEADLAAEILNRKSADTALSDRIDDAEADLAAEILNRESADTALSDRIDNIDVSGEAGGALVKLRFLGRTIRTGDYKSSQGMVVRMQGTTPVIYTAYFNYDYGNLKCIVQAIGFNGGVIATSNEFTCDHANDMTYDSQNDLLYITSASNIVVMNPSTLTVVRTVAIDHAPAGIAYDADDQKIYTIENGNIRRLGTDFVTEETWTGAVPYTVVQCLEYHKNHLYVTMNQPNNVVMLDMNFNTVAVYGVQEFCSDFYPLGESQSISFYGNDDDFVINGKPREYNYDGVGFDAYEVGIGITTFGYGNFNSGVRYDVSYTQMAIYRNYNPMFVDSSSVVFTPTGDSASPFKSLGEIALVLNAPNITPSNIVLQGDFSTETLAINNHYVNIGGADGGNPVPIYSANFYNCVGQLRNVRIMNDANGALHFVRSRMALLYVYPVAGAVNQILNSDAGSLVTVNPTHTALYPFNYRTTSTGAIITKTGNGVAPSNFAMIAEYVGAGNATDHTVEVDTALARYSELMFVVMRSSNSRIVDSKVVPAGSFINGGCYMLGGYSTTNTNILGGCFIYIDDTHININFATGSATENFKFRIFDR